MYAGVAQVDKFSECMQVPDGHTETLTQTHQGQKNRTELNTK